MTREPLDRNLFDVEDIAAADMPAVRDMYVERVTTRDVAEFAQRYHYTHTAGAPAWRWGLWHGVTLYGVVSYNLPTRDVCESVFGDEHFDKVWHMGRLILAEEAPHNSESRLIAGSLHAIKQEHPHVWAVITYAAQDAGHIGYVYQATNALYIGTGGDPVYYVDQKGNRRPTYDGHFVNAARGAEKGWTRHMGLPKHRYLYLLGSKTQRKQRRALLRYEVKPYPKETPADLRQSRVSSRRHTTRLVTRHVTRLEDASRPVRARADHHQHHHQHPQTALEVRCRVTDRVAHRAFGSGYLARSGRNARGQASDVSHHPNRRARLTKRRARRTHAA